MGIIETKAKRAAQEKMNAKTASLNAERNHNYEVSTDYSTLEHDENLLNGAPKIALKILDYITELTADPDYYEAFKSVKELYFIPVQSDEDGFDYEQSCSYENGTINIKYSMHGHIHGGYERSLMRLF